MTHTDELELVVDLYRHSSRISAEEVLRLCSELTDEAFSARMMSKIVDMPMSRVLEAMGKTKRTGGRLAPESLPLILELRDWGFSGDKVLTCLRQGTSQGLLARLTGISQSRISRTWRNR